MNKIRDIIGTAKRTIGKVWSTLVDVVKKPIRLLFQGINKALIHPINTVTHKFAGNSLHIDDLPLNFARGGPVRGRGGPTDDAIPARLSNGEFVVRAKAAAKHGPLLEAINNDEGAGGFRDRLRGIRRVARDAALGAGVNRGALLGAGAEPAGRAVAAGVEKLAHKLLDPVISRLRDRYRDSGVLPRTGVEAMAKVVQEVESLGRASDQAAVAPNDGSAGAALLGLGLGKLLGVRAFPLPRGSYRVGVPLGGYPGHTGQDFPARVGTPVYAPITGRMVPVNLGNRSYGRHVNIYGAGGLRSIQAHLSAFSRGAGIVRAGQMVGRVGSSGNSTGPHLHQEFRRNGAVINPRSILKFDKGGILDPGMLGINKTRRPERILPPRETVVYEELLSVLKKGGGVGGRGDLNITVNVSGGGDRRTGRLVAEEINSLAVLNRWNG
jgi:murein DD-endopeptidase MepM/ murein hydrolase activator NlpD